MQRFGRSQRLLLAYSLFVVLSSLLVLSWIISSPSESSSAILFSFSVPRLAMAIGLFFVCILYVTLALKGMKTQAWADMFLGTWFERKGTSQRIGWLAAISFGLGWIGCFFPDYRVGIVGNYWVRIQPVMAFILLISSATLFVLFVVRNRLSFQDFKFSPLKLGLSLFMLCLLVLGGMFYSGFGVVSLDDFWYGAGVPILVSQFIAAIIGGLFFLHLEAKWQSRWSDRLICILIYVLAAYLWAREPLHGSFLFTDPSYPNHAFYPFADAATFDMASQFPLIGNKIAVYNSVFFERPLYLGFLVYLHILFGQDYEKLMAVQAGIFAILPVLIYLIGKSLNVRSVGFSAAVVAIFRGINSIAASNMIDMANPKMILTDFPTAIGIALVVLFVCEWLKDDKPNHYFPTWIGGVIGATLMLRTNALLLLVFIPLYAFIRFSKERKQWLIGSCLILLGVIAITLPWEIRNLSLGGQMYGSITTKFINVIKQRYLPAPQPGSSLLHDQRIAVTTLGITQPISLLYSATDVIQSNRSCDTVVCFSSNHFLHNILTSILIFPTSPILDNLVHLIRERNPYYWKADWDGTFRGTAPLFLILNVFFITTGIAFAWREKRLPGLTPLTIFVVYNISNGLARTSGGRYIVPVDWIVPFYYLLGVFYMIVQLAGIAGTQWNIFSETPKQEIPQQNGTNHLPKAFLVFAILLGLGALIPLSEALRPPRYLDISPMAILATNRSLIENAGLKFDDLGKFLQSSDSSILIGRALYPRYYKMSQGDAPFAFYPYVTMDFPRTAFQVIGPLGEKSVVLPGDAPSYLPHASDVLVLGCNGQHYLDALVVIVLDGKGAIYTRKPESELLCPLPQPVCNNNSICQ